MLQEAIKAYPGCPSLSWMIASRVTNRYEESDAFITFTGRKGSSKSTSSLAFCEGLSEDIAYIRGNGAKPEDYFNIDHVRTISKTGAIELLTSGILKKQNAIILLDDAGTQWSNRNFATMINKYLNQIVQIMRIYQGVLVANFIMKDHIDKQAREMVDYRIQMLWKNTRVNQAVFKCKYIEQGENGEYTKYLTWNKKRIKRFVIGKPSKELYAQYKIMRGENTDTFIEEAQKEVRVRVMKIDDPDSKKDKVDYDTAWKVVELYLDPLTPRNKYDLPNENFISKKACTTRHLVGKYISMYENGKLPRKGEIE